eukprot:350008-Chlamydomonas_euryale.AAC.6
MYNRGHFCCRRSQRDLNCVLPPPPPLGADAGGRGGSWAAAARGRLGCGTSCRLAQGGTSEGDRRAQVAAVGSEPGAPEVHRRAQVSAAGSEPSAPARADECGGASMHPPSDAVWLFVRGMDGGTQSCWMFGGSCGWMLGREVAG